MFVPDRVYSVLHLKSFDVTGRRFAGIATTPSTDRQGDIIEPLGGTFTNPLPLFLFHDSKQPVGLVNYGTPTKSGIPFSAEIPEVVEEGDVKRMTDKAAHFLKYRLIRAVSMGFRALEGQVEILKSGGLRFKKWEALETSLIPIPANVEAVITTIKSFDTLKALSRFDAKHLAESGAPGARSSVYLPGVSGIRKDSIMEAQTISEQLSEKRFDLQQKSSRLTELIDSDAAGSLTDDEQTELESLQAGVDTLTKSVSRLSTLEAAQAAQAQTVTTRPGYTPTSVAPHSRIQVTDHAKELPKGTLFTRYAMAVAAGKGSHSDTLAYAKRWDAQTPEVSRYIKAVEGTSVVASPGWGGELVFQDNLASEFVELLRPQTIIGRIEDFRRVPFNVRVPVQAGGSTVNWVGEAAPKPVTELSFTTLTVPYHKIAGIIVLTEELVRLSSPSAEETVRRDLTDQIAQFMDQQFIRVAVASGANNPASVTNGVTSPAASGTTLAALYADLKTALGTFDTAEISTEGLVIVTTPAVARILSMMVTTLGTAPSGFNMSATGGTLLGYQVVVSASVDAGTLVILKPSEVFLADDGRVTLDASNQATLDMAGGSTPDFNLWQKNCIGIRAERWITWVKRRAGAVAVIDTIAYVPGT